MGIMWEFSERVIRWCGGWTNVCILLTLFGGLCGSGSVEGKVDGRLPRLVVSNGRGFTERVSGVGEVLRVDPEEYERLVKEQGVRVVKGEIERVSGVGGANNVSLDKDVDKIVMSGNGSDVSVIEAEVRDAGVPHVASLVNVEVSTEGSSTTIEEEEISERGSTSTTSGGSSSTDSSNPVVVAVNPEDSSRTQQHEHRYTGIDRRKVVSKPDGGAAQDLSFTGILNGLLDSFINDGPPPQRPQPSRNQPTTTTTTQKPSSEDISILEDDEEEEETSPEDVDTRPKSSLSSKPSLQSTPTSEDISNEQENASEEPLEDEDDTGLEDYVQGNSSTSQRTPSSKQCQGECRNIIFGLFLCDEIDNDAFCPESGLACCVNNPEPEFNRYKPYGNSSSEEEALDMDKVPVVTIQESNEDVVEDEDFDEDEQAAVSSSEKKPIQQQPTQMPQQPQPHRYPQYGNRPLYNPQNPQQYYYPPPPPKTHNNPPMMMHPPPPRMPLPCPRYCVKTFLESYCSDRLPSQFACGVDGFCCAHDVPVDSIKEQQQNEDEDERDDLGNDGLGQGEVQVEDEKSVNKVIGPCTEEVGSCVSKNIINIICFAHAIPTDMYTCPRSSMKCCARKTALPKDSLPSTTTPPPVKLDNSITRNASSGGSYQKTQLPGPPQILPQFAPQHPPPGPPPQHQYVQNQPFHQQVQPQMAPPTHAPTAPPLAETPPPPIGIPATQFTNPFSSNSLGPVQQRVPARQPVGQYVCGVKGVPTVSKKRRKKRVVGGSDSLPGEWCWQVALINSLNQYLCGGALIGTQWVLTAAHCVTNIVRSGDAIYVRVGDHDLTSRYGSPGAQTLRVATTYIHHNHNSQTLDNDIALLKLQGNAALKEGVCLVCLPSRNHLSEIPGKRCIVTGYGYMGESGPIPLRIREANLPIVSDDECVRKVNSVTEKVFALPMSSFCAGGDKSGHDACQGDGGGPLVCRADDPSTGDTGTGYYELTGLVSWGFGCGRENVPGVYVKVSSFIGWIHQIIRSN